MAFKTVHRPEHALKRSRVPLSTAKSIINQASNTFKNKTPIYKIIISYKVYERLCKGPIF